LDSSAAFIETAGSSQSRSLKGRIGAKPQLIRLAGVIRVIMIVLEVGQLPREYDP
jgi:hypothetical protein